VTKFNRDPATGKLTWPSAYSGSELDGAVGVALDTEGENVYVASCDEGAVVTFERDASSGGLSRTQTLALSGLGCARSIAVSPGDEHVYVASSGDDTVLIFDRSAVDGKLSYLGTVEDDTFGVDGLDGAYSVIVSPGGENVYVASYYDDAVAHFDRNADGSLSYQSDDLWKDGTGLALYLDGANGLAISPDGKFVYVASRVDDSVTVFRRLSVSGNLQFVNAYRDGVGGVDGLNGARAVAVSPDGNQVYVASQNDHALAVFDRDETFGLLQFVGVYKDGQSGVDGLNTANGVAVSPDNGHVYVTGYGDDAVAVFARWRVYLPLVLR
jgi:DNA-binding beta-propeller fold protein YncE